MVIVKFQLQLHTLKIDVMISNIPFRLFGVVCFQKLWRADVTKDDQFYVQLKFFIRSVFYTVGPRFTTPLGEYFNDYVERSLRCFEYFCLLGFDWFRNQIAL